MRTTLLALAISWAGVQAAGASPAAPVADPASTPGELASQGLMDELVPGAIQSHVPLIAWDVQSGQGFVLGANLETVEKSFHGPESPTVAISPGDLRAYVTNQDRTVEIDRPDGGQSTLDIGQKVGGLAWLDDHRLALSPSNGEFLVEIWDVDSGKRVRQICRVPTISQAPGFRPMRATEIAWDPDHQRLHTLNAFTGKYRAFDLSQAGSAQEGAPAIEAQVDDRARDRYDQWIASSDRQLVAQGEFQGPLIWRFSLGLDTGGTAWVVERCDGAEDEDSTTGTAHLLAVDPRGTKHRIAVETACCSLEALPWRNLLVFYRSATPSRSGCFAPFSRPTLGAAQSASWWLEATPLSLPKNPRSRQSEYPPTVRARFPRGSGTAAAEARLESMDSGQVLVCTGGPGRPLDCEQLWIDSGTSEPPSLHSGEGAGRPVAGRITLDGEGVPGAAISLVPADFRTTRLVTLPLVWPTGSEQPVRKVATDGAGRFTLPQLSAGDYRLVVQLPGGRLDQGTTFTVPSPGRTRPEDGLRPVDLGELDFPAGLRIEVAVLDTDGQPLPGAQTGAAQPLPSAQRAQGAQRAPGALTLFSAQADENGHAVLDGLAPDRSVVVTCQAPGHVQWRERFDAPPGYVSCSLDRLGRITGRVVDEDGEPVTNGRVTLAGGSGFNAEALETTVLDKASDGRFAFEGVEPASFHLEATSPGRAAKGLSVTLEAGEVRDLGELVLEPGVRWIVQVVAATDKEGALPEPMPVPGAVVAAVAPRDAVRSTTTDEEGEAEIEGPASGALTLEVRAPGFAPRRVEMPERLRSLGTDPFQVVLEPAGWIEAHVWDESNGTPCAGCQVTLSGVGPVQSLVTDGSGTARSEPLAPGSWRASLARLQGYGSVVTRSGGDNARMVTVTPGKTIEVRFGDPRETLDVVISPPPSQPAAWRLVVRDSSGAYRLYDLDASGTATVRRPTGGATLALMGAGMTIELGALADDADDPAVVERPTGLVTARLPSIPDEGGPANGALRVDLVDLSSGRRVAEVEAQAGGEIRVPFLRGGTYAIQESGRTLATAAVIDGEETDLGELQ